jgi:hypothetical protein
MNFQTYYKQHFESKNEASRFLEISRPTVYTLLRGKPVGKKIAKRIEEKTGRRLRAAALMQL